MGAAILVGIGGFFGSIARYLVDRNVSRLAAGAFPWGTFVVNISGSFVVGLLFALIVDRSALPGHLRAPLSIGFVGAYTTFSTLLLESWRMVEDGAWQFAIINIGGSIAVGLVAVIAGLLVGRAV
jgi:CrcB protein